VPARPVGSSAADFPRVVVEAVPTRKGERALRFAAELAGAHGRLTVVGVAVMNEPAVCCSVERVTQAMWNGVMRERAVEDCAYAATVLGSGAAERRVVEEASRGKALSVAARELAADVLVVPAARGPFDRFALRRLRRRVRCAVLECP
jgi:hypothetical protein